MVLLGSVGSRRQWFVVVAGVPAALWLYGSIVSLGRTYLPPSDPPAIELLLPIDGEWRAADDEFGMEVDVRVDSCANPVHVAVQATGPDAGRRRNWLRSDARFTAAVVGAQPVRRFRVFVGEQIDPSRLFDGAFRGGPGTYPVTTRPVSRAPQQMDIPGARGITGRPRPFASPRADPSLTWSFDADWLSPRAYGSCYLQVPDLDAGVGPPVWGGFLPPAGRETVSVANAVMGLDTRLRVLASDSDAPPTRSLAKGFWSCPRRGSASDCAGGYVALSARVSDSASSAQVPYLVALSFVVGLLGEALMRFRWPPRRRRPASGRTRSSRQR